MSSDSGPGPELSGRLGYLLKHAAMRLEKLHAQALTPIGIDARELGVLLVLAGQDRPLSSRRRGGWGWTVRRWSPCSTC